MKKFLSSFSAAQQNGKIDFRILNENCWGSFHDKTVFISRMINEKNLDMNEDNSEDKFADLWIIKDDIILYWYLE